MKKRLIGWMILALVAALCVGAMAEGLSIEAEWTEGQAVAAAEADVVSEAVELAIPEDEGDLPVGDADEGKAAVSAAAGVAIDGENFPDAAFREYVKKEFDTDGDGVLSEEERDAVESVTITWEKVTSLKGIEWFQHLTSLNCFDNLLTSLDVSHNTALEILTCFNNRLTSLDVSHNTVLRKLECSENRLTELDLSSNIALEELSCGENQLTTLDMSHNTALKRLYSNDNKLKSLDVSRNPDLEDLYCYNNQLTSLDVSHNTALKYLVCGSNQLTGLDVSRNTDLCELICSSDRLVSLDVSKNTALTMLWCDSNQLTSLDVSRNTALTELWCQSNRLTSLDVSHNAALGDLSCYNNRIAEIDISNCSDDLKSASRKAPETTETGSTGFEFNDGEVYIWYTIDIDPFTSVILNGKVVHKRTAPAPVSLAKAKVTVKAQVYAGKALKPAVTVKLNGKTLKKGTDYTVTYENNRDVGTATVTVEGAGKYYDAVRGSFAINPKAVTVLKLTAGSKRLTAKWKKVSGVTGYELQYGLKKSFKGAKTVTVKSGKPAKAVLKKLTAGKTCYVRVRAYKKVGGKTYYSAWLKSSKKVK